jgi:hypothetical protein
MHLQGVDCGLDFAIVESKTIRTWYTSDGSFTDESCFTRTVSPISTANTAGVLEYVLPNAGLRVWFQRHPESTVTARKVISVLSRDLCPLVSSGEELGHRI